MPPPADAEVSLAQLTLLPPEPELEEELDEQPAAANNAAAATPAAAYRYDNFTVPPESFPVPKWITAARKRIRAAVPRRSTDPLIPQLRVQDKRI
jgi:hypothetical protein